MWIKRIAWACVGLVAIGALAILALLLPAHLHIRSIEPELPTQSELTALLDEPDRPTSISYFVTSDQMSEGRLISHTTFVIEWEDGRILLIDSGMNRETMLEFAEMVDSIYDAEPPTIYGTVTDWMGDDLDRVAGIGFSHLHTDHVQGIELICGATDRTITALQTSDQATEHNLHTEGQAELIETSSCLTQSVLEAGKTTSSEFPGIGVYPLAGHTPGSTLFAVPVGDTLWLLTGDISNNHDDLIENNPKGWFYSYIMVPENEARLARLRVFLAELDSDQRMTAIVSHDAGAIAESGMELWDSGMVTR